MDTLLIEKFEIPEAAANYAELFFTEEEAEFVRKIDKEIFTKSDIESIIHTDADAFIKDSYRHGIISLSDETGDFYKLNNFYGRLDIFAVSETEKYRSIPKEDRKKIDDWYFDQYYESLDKDLSVRPTQDEVLTLQETLDFIDAQDRPVYLNYCDCRSLTGDCKMPTKTCITYRDGINTFAHRGLSEKIDKERAKEVVKNADKSGLMHTVNPNGICNCCDDCCYLFRSQKKRNSTGFWPQSHHIVDIHKDACVGCGLCTRRCHFKVFKKEGKEIQLDVSKCVGCGICATACPAGALEMKGRE